MYARIHRHTGGLEKSTNSIIKSLFIHRHTGGLENLRITLTSLQLIHRHTGGLEMQAKS